MKIISKIILLAFSLMLMTSTFGFAQNSDRGNRGNSDNRGKVEQNENRKADSLDVRQDRTNRNSDSLRAGNSRANRQADSLNRGQGHAYGRDKGEMTGREFGQARAAAARNLNDQVERLDKNIATAEETVRRGKTEIERAEEALEEGNMNEEQKQTRIEQIEKAKEQLSDLEEVIEKEKEKVNNARKKLEELLKDNVPAVNSDENEEI